MRAKSTPLHGIACCWRTITTYSSYTAEASSELQDEHHEHHGELAANNSGYVRNYSWLNPGGFLPSEFLTEPQTRSLNSRAADPSLHYPASHASTLPLAQSPPVVKEGFRAVASLLHLRPTPASIQEGIDHRLFQEASASVPYTPAGPAVCSSKLVTVVPGQ